MIDRFDDDFPIRKNPPTKGRQTQKFRNIIRQIDPSNLEEDSEDTLFDDLDLRAKIPSQRRPS